MNKGLPKPAGPYINAGASPQKWRRGRDSNPREIALKLISSQPRYDRFDTSPYIILPQKRENAI